MCFHFADFDPFLSTYIPNTYFFSLRVLSRSPPSDWRRIKLPSGRGWLRYSSIYHLRISSLTITGLFVGRWQDVFEAVGSEIQKWLHHESASQTPEHLYAHRGDWTAENIAELESISKELSSRVVWM
jgi:hypothetical protein